MVKEQFFSSEIPYGPTHFDAIMSWWMGVDTHELSTVDFAASDDSETNWAVAEGLGAVVASAARGLDVELACPVSAIDWSGRRIRVTSPRGMLECQAVVVTVPTTLLARGEPRFTPALPPEYEEAFAGLPLGLANKVFLEVEDGALPFEGTTNFIASGTTVRTTSFSVRPAGHDVLLAYFGGGYARELERDGALVAAAREELARLFGADVERGGPVGARILLRGEARLRALPRDARPSPRRPRLLRRRRLHDADVWRDQRRLGVGRRRRARCRDRAGRARGIGRRVRVRRAPSPDGAAAIH